MFWWQGKSTNNESLKSKMEWKTSSVAPLPETRFETLTPKPEDVGSIPTHDEYLCDEHICSVSSCNLRL